MTREPLVSVLTPVHDGEAFLAEAIESVLAQTYGNWRYEIIDNASTDRTGEIARAYAARDPRVTVHRFDELVPQIENFNRMFRHADPDAEYVKVIHADDALYPACLERMVDVGERHPSVVVIGAPRLDGEVINLDSVEPGVEVVDGDELSRDLLAARRPSTFGAPTNTMLRAAPLRAYELVQDPTFLHQGDMELCYRLLSAGDFGFVHEVLTFTRRQGGTTRPWARRMGLEQSEHVRMLQGWGRHYLTRPEYERRMAVASWRYLRSLVRNAPRWRDPDYRRIQSVELRRIAANGGIGPVVLTRGALSGFRRRVRVGTAQA